MASSNTSKLHNFWLETKRILAISKKPTKKEFNLTVKVTLVGMVITGGISYLIQLISFLINPKAAGSGA